MADIELEVLSRAIIMGAIDQLIAAGIEDRHFFDSESRTVFRTCVDCRWRASSAIIPTFVPCPPMTSWATSSRNFGSTAL
jgi:hypothetical protein